MKKNNIKIGLFLAKKKIFRDKGIFIFTSLIVTLGFINIFFLTSFISGMGASLNTQLIELQFGNIIITPKNDNIFIDNPDQIINKIRRIPGVIGVTKRLKLGATLQTEKKDKSVSPWYFIGIDPKEEPSVTDLQDYFIDGSYLSENDDDKIIIGSEMVGKADGLILPKEDSLESDAGDMIYVTFENGLRKKYLLKGIIGARDLYSIISAYITFNEAERVLGIKNKASLILVKTPTGKEDNFVKEIKKLGIGETILTWRDKAMTTKAITGSFDIMNNIFRVVGLFIIFITLIIIIYINILNSKKSIGIFRAIGIKKETIVYTYVWLSLLYASAGILIGSLLIKILFAYLQSNPIQGPLGNMFPIFNMYTYTISIILIFMAALVGALIPAIAINKKNIMDLITGR